jgi:hypothetical protein
MIDATAKSMSAAFFRKFAEEIAQPQGAVAVAPTAAAAAPRTAPLAFAAPAAAPTTSRTRDLALLLAGFIAGYIMLRLAGAAPGTAADWHGLIECGLAGVAGFCLGRRPVVIVQTPPAA